MSTTLKKVKRPKYPSARRPVVLAKMDGSS